MSEFLHILPSCHDVSTVIACLFHGAQEVAFHRLRYYHYTPNDQKLVSSASAGHKQRVAAMLNVGGIVRFRAQAPLKSHDSFWCFELHGPVLFRLDESSQGPLDPTYVFGIPLISLASDQCDDVLHGDKSTAWVDFPLSVGGREIGKVSCDMSPDDLGPDLPNRISAVWALLQIAAPYLELLDAELVSFPLNAVIRAINECNSLNAFFFYCTTVLPETSLFNCKYASIFTVSRDVLGSERLILRKTSYGPSQRWENLKCYRLGDEGLTPWVARNGRTLRVQDLSDPNNRDKTLAAYDPALHWAPTIPGAITIPDSDHHSTFLAVPIRDGSDKVIGVLRFAEKLHGTHFTDTEQRLLERIATECIAEKLATLAQVEFSAQLSSHLEALSTLSVAESLTFVDLSHVLRDRLATFFPETGGKKLYLINMLLEDRTTFRHHAIGGSLPISIDRPAIPLRDTLTSLALQHSEGSVFINDITVAVEHKVFQRLNADVVCALASRVSFQSQDYGAIVVESDHYDIFPETHGRILEILALRAAEIYTRREVLALASAPVSLRHDCLAALGRIDTLLDELALRSNLEDLRPARELNAFLMSMIDAYCRSAHLKPEHLEKISLEFRVLDKVKTVKRAAEAEIPNNCGIKCEIDPALTFVGYPAPIIAILYNLAKNALAHSHSAAQRVVISATKADGWLEIAVEDFGEGMSPAQAAQLFNWDVLNDFHLVWEEPDRLKRLGVFLSRKLAHWYHLRDDRRAILAITKAKVSEGCRVVLKVPEVTESHLPR